MTMPERNKLIKGTCYNLSCSSVFSIHKMQNCLIIFNLKVRHFPAWGHQDNHNQPLINIWSGVCFFTPIRTIPFNKKTECLQLRHPVFVELILY